ncbi:nucleoside phosphatase family-domain-containing protein [Peziza echinospora]|nr:nucleoside phosphatase family-domain-containing protein [Peziza echinospora]
MGKPHNYGVVLDAGSSGTRIHIYQWEQPEHARLGATRTELAQLPRVKTKKDWAKKVKPGVSTFGPKPYEVGEYLAPLLQHAADIIPPESVPDTPLFLLATAGVRLLPLREQKLLLEQICTYARKHTRFLLPECDLHVQVISGETEGLYGWIAANYLLGGFDSTSGEGHGEGHHTYGFLDMGGASAQIAFAPNATEAKKHAEDLKLLRLRTLDGRPQEHLVFVTTWLGFGMNEARALYISRLVEASGGQGIDELPDPCLPKGVIVTLEGSDNLVTKKPGDPLLVGTGLFQECLRQTYPLLQKDIPCSDAPCLLKGIHVPGIDFGINHFVGVSEFWHTTNEIFSFGDEHPYDYTQYQQKVEQFCAMDWREIEAKVDKGKWGEKVDREKARQVCFKASWLTNIMHNGIGIPRVGIDPIEGHNVTDVARGHGKGGEKGFIDPFQAVDKINGVELSWTLGKILLYASWQIPAITSEPVGFGPNTEFGVLTNWQSPASGEAVSPPPHSGGGGGSVVVNGTTEDANLHDSPFPEAQQYSSPPSSSKFSGFFFFFILVMLGIVIFAGRDRRARFYRGFSKFRKTATLRLLKTRRNSKRKIIGPNGGVVYERIMEEGGLGMGMGMGNGGSVVLMDPDEFELGGGGGTGSGSASDEFESLSDSSLSGKLGGGGGMAGIGMGLGEGRMMRPKPKGRQYSKLAASAAGSTGLMVRTDSRERLARSRDVSPTGGLRGGVGRIRSPLPR